MEDLVQFMKVLESKHKNEALIKALMKELDKNHLIRTLEELQKLMT